MSNVTGFPGPDDHAEAEFDPDNVLQEEINPSAFDDVDAEAAEPEQDLPSRGTASKRGGITVKTGFIAVGAVVILAVLYSSLKPLFAPSSAPRPQSMTLAVDQPPVVTASASPAAQTGAQVSTQAPAQPPQEQTVSQPDAVQVAATMTPDSGGALAVTAPLPGQPSATDTSPDQAVSSAVVQGTPTTSQDGAGVAANADWQPAVAAVRMDLQAQITVLQQTVAALQTQLAQKPSTAAAPAAKKPSVRRTAPRAAETAAKPAPSVAVAHSPADTRPKPKLKAVLVGQAWFELGTGRTLTATPGESVPGYGRIKAIDADAGEVRFDDGSVAR